MPTKGKKRKAPTDEEEPAREYAALRPRIHHVSKSAVRNRWETLPASTQGKVRELLKSGERPTFMIHREERRRLEAQQAVNSVQNMFSKRIPKIPFPPGTKDSHFDYESVMKSNRSIEAQLTSTTHYNQLLRAEIDRRKELLAAEKEELQNVEGNAKAEVSLQKRQNRKLHLLLKDSDLADEENSIFMNLATKAPVLLLKTDDDPILQRLKQQLANHLESMQSNVGQLEKVKCSIPRSKTGLGDLVT